MGELAGDMMLGLDVLRQKKSKISMRTIEANDICR